MLLQKTNKESLSSSQQTVGDEVCTTSVPQVLQLLPGQEQQTSQPATMQLVSGKYIMLVGAPSLRILWDGFYQRYSTIAT